MMKKIVYAISLATIVILMLTGCMTPRKLEWKPCSQPNTKWESEDGTITFYVDNNHQIFGTMNVGDELIDVYIAFGAERDTSMYIYPASAVDREKNVVYDWLKYGYWHCDFESESEFVATVRDFPFFEKGDKFIIHRVDEEKE
jgi:hypothetical protein